MKKSVYFFVIFAAILFVGWGSVGHRMINRKTYLSFPSVMNPLRWFTDSMAFHASDADIRKNVDPSEEYRHYIDIEYYQEYLTNGRIPQNWDSLVAIHGLNFVIGNGYVPFAIIATTDSVKKYFLLHDWRNAMLKAADLGHYVADAHQPLHCTRYYDGWSTSSNGIHSRYETGLIVADTANIQYTGSSVVFVNDINNYAFNMVYNSNKLVDSVYRGDSLAYAQTGYHSGTAFNQAFWSYVGSFTIRLFKEASYQIMSLVYTAWVNAGSPLPVFVANEGTNANDFKLNQNYPNPFNPKTNIKFSLQKSANVSIKIYDIAGSEVQTLIDGYKPAGDYSVSFDGAKLSSGVYFYIMNTDNGFKETKMMTLIK